MRGVGNLSARRRFSVWSVCGPLAWRRLGVWKPLFFPWTVKDCLAAVANEFPGMLFLGSEALQNVWRRICSVDS